MSRQVWKGSTLLNPEPPVLVSCGPLEKPNLITVGWCGTICTQPSMVSISVRPERFSHHLIRESGVFVINLPNESLVPYDKAEENPFRHYIGRGMCQLQGDLL